MKKIKLAYCGGMAGCVIFILALAGCMSIGSSPTPRFYTLHAVAKAESGQKINLATNVIIGISPVKIPEYQDRPQIVTRDKKGMLTFAQFDRWGEPLDAALTRLMIENISIMLPPATVETFPCDPAVPVKYQVIADVLQLESRLDQDLVFTAQWTIINVQEKKMMVTKKSEFRQPINPRNYAGLTEALSAACASLSAEIAASLAALVNPPEIK